LCGVGRVAATDSVNSTKKDMELRQVVVFHSFIHVLVFLCVVTEG